MAELTKKHAQRYAILLLSYTVSVQERDKAIGKEKKTVRERDTTLICETNSANGNQVY